MSWKQLIFYSLFGAVALLYAAIIFATPIAADDFGFLSEIMRTSKLPDGSESLWEGITTVIRNRCTYDNTRLANIAVTPLLPFPRIFAAIPAAIAMILTLVLMLRLSNSSPRRPIAYTSMMAAFIVTIPWYDNMFSIVYAYNYILGSFCLLGGTWLFSRRQEISPWWMFPAGFICGAWHEGFGSALLGGCLLVVIAHRKMLTAGRIAFIIGAVIAMLWHIVPGTMATRISAQGTGFELRSAIVTQLPGVAILIVWCILVARRATRGFAMRPIMLMCVAGIISGIATQSLAGYARAGFQGMIVAVLAFGYMLNHIRLKPSGRFMRLSAGTATACAWLLIFAHLGTTAVYAVKMHRELYEAFRIYYSPECTDGEIYMDITTPGNAPRLLLRNGTRTHMEYYGGTTHMHQGIGIPGKRMRVLPRELKGYTPGHGTPLEGNAKAEIYRGLIVMPYEPRIDVMYQILPFSMDFGHGMQPVYASWREFTGADSLRYYYVQLQPTIRQTFSPDTITAVSVFPLQ